MEDLATILAFVWLGLILVVWWIVKGGDDA